jgi:nicotinamidase/pyrazinamidase
MVDYDRSTALVVVDVQKRLRRSQGQPLRRRGRAGRAAGEPRDPAGTGGGAVVVYTQDWHPAQTPHFQSGGGVWPEHCVQYTWGAQLHPDLQVAGEVVRKGQGGEDGY